MSNALKLGNNQSLASVLDLYRLSLMYQMNCHQVGEIVSFNPSTQTAEVQIKMVRVEDDQIKEYPLLIDCPCVVLSGGKGRLTFPIEQGDSCIVLFNDRDIDNWYSGGQKMPPRTPRMHNFADAIALVGIRNKQNQITDYFANGVELKYGKSSIQLRDGYIDIKGNVNIVQNTVDKNSLTAYVIDTYHSGTDWYRVWSDGWCEQGGSITTSNGTIIFLKEFIDTNYTFISQASDFDDYAISVSTWGNKTKSSIQVRCGYNGSPYAREVSWEAKGYIK